MRVDQAAIAIRSVDFSLAGLPPGGVRGDRLESASKISSIDTTLLASDIARRLWHEVTAAASEAQEARIARFSCGACSNSERSTRSASRLAVRTAPFFDLLVPNLVARFHCQRFRVAPYICAGEEAGHYAQVLILGACDRSSPNKYGTGQDRAHTHHVLVSTCSL